MAESDQVHNYAYPSVASWLHSTSLAQLDGTTEPRNVDDPLDTSSPDDFYKSAYTTAQHEIAPPPADMAASRQRQPAANGAVRSPSKATTRSVSGPASAANPARSPPPVSNKVKALAERFERSPGSSPTSTAPAVRSRSKGPSRVGGHDPAKRSNASVSSTASAARPSKEATYGAYKFNNLKPRERPQPAPAAPRNAPSTRRTTGSRSSLDPQTSPTRKKVTSPAKRPASGGRQPFFGEVVGGQDVTSPGYGIPTFEGTEEEVVGVDTVMEAPAEGARLPATTFTSPQHERSRSGATSTMGGEASRAHLTQRAAERNSARPSPASKIPVRTRRLSATSDTTSSSSRSVRYTPTRASNHSNRASPTRLYRKPMGADSHGADQTVLPSLAYRAYRERGKSPAGPRSGPGAQAVASAPPTSPRLRNSRERQALSPGPTPRTSGAYGEHSYFPNTPFDSHHDISAAFDTAPASGAQIPPPDARDDHFPRTHEPHHHPEQSPREEHRNSTSGHQQRLSLQTSRIPLPPIQQPLSATTDFEESPVLGLPGSFVLTPPTTHEEQQPQLLQPTTFQPSGREKAPRSPEIEESEVGVRESIPIMLGDEQSSEPWRPRSEDISESLQALTYGYSMDRNYAKGAMQPASHYDRDDSPIDPYGNRDSLRPEDSASIAPYRSAGPLTFNTETYSVVNSVLNMYHQSPVITPELASVSRERVQRVSPVIAQHKDWGSKEATETYLARLLSDANGASEEASRAQERRSASPARPALTSPQEEEDAYDFGVSGTAIIYPSQSRRYSRGSRGSTTTTIQDDASRSGSSSGNPPHDHTAYSTANGRIELPQLAWTNGGLGLSYHGDLPPSPSSQPTPPRPTYSPPPPPIQPSIDQHMTELNDSQSPFSHQYPRPAAVHDQVDLHPARVFTPVSQSHEESLEARYGPPSMNEHDQPSAPASRGTAENGQPDTAKLALIKRYRILEELLTTEHQFCIDMMIAHNIFEATAQSLMTEKEKKVLFSNCKELEKFSLSLFRAFKKAAKPIVNYDIPPPTGPWNRDSSDSRPSNPSDSSLHIQRPSEDSPNQYENCTLENDHLTAVGQVFLDNKEKMERLYTTYYLNQENAAAYIKKHQSNPELTGWVAACFEQVENMTQAWDLDSLLLKPCQRLLKYPLLLDGLETSSDPDHPDLHNIKAARKELLAMSARINEAKKRADTFRAATSEGKKEKKQNKGIGKTFVKAFIPKVDKNKAYDEADKTFKDQDYKSREQKFGGHFFQLQIVMRDFEQYLDAITEHYQQLNIVFIGFVSVCEVAPSVHPELESTWRKWAMAHFELQNKALEDHVSLRTP
jgi:hypothetical protein